MGAFEMDAFARGTMALCQAVASSHALSIIGGGDSNAAVKKAGEAEISVYMSTGGGAFLELMEGKTLPGVEALDNDACNLQWRTSMKTKSPLIAGNWKMHTTLVDGCALAVGVAKAFAGDFRTGTC